MTAAKKNDSCTASISIDNSTDVDSLVAALATEDVFIVKDGSCTTIEVSSGNLADLRARLNTALRSLQAASEALIEVDRSA